MTARQRGHDRGFTLIELVVAMSVASVLFGLAVVVIGQGLRVTTKVQTHVGVVTDAQYALDRLSRDVRTADPILDGTATKLTVTVRRGGACRLVTYEVSTTTTAPGSGYRSTGKALTTSRRACGTATAGVSRVLIPSVPPALTPFSYYARGSTTPLPVPLSAADLKKVARISVSVSAAPRATTSSPTITTDINVRNFAT